MTVPLLSQLGTMPPAPHGLETSAPPQLPNPWRAPCGVPNQYIILAIAPSVTECVSKLKKVRKSLLSPIYIMNCWFLFPCYLEIRHVLHTWILPGWSNLAVVATSRCLQPCMVSCLNRVEISIWVIDESWFLTLHKHPFSFMHTWVCINRCYKICDTWNE